MTPEKRAWKIVDENWQIEESIETVAKIVTQALRDHGNERLEAAEKECDAYTRWYDTKRAIRALMDKPEETE